MNVILGLDKKTVAPNSGVLIATPKKNFLIGKIILIIAGALAGLLVINVSSFAAVGSEKSYSNISNGTLVLTTKTVNVKNLTNQIEASTSQMVPGDTVTSYIDLTNSGTLSMGNLALSLAASPSNALTSNSITGLQVTIKQCSVSWSNAGVCTGVISSVLGVTPAAVMTGTQSASLKVLNAKTVNHLQLVLTLPSSNETTVNGVLPVGSIQGLSTSVTWAFTETMQSLGK